MNPERLINQECQVIRRTAGTPDALGNVTWTTTTSSALTLIQPVSSEEVEDRTAGKFTHRAFFLPDVTIGHKDQITVASGRSWEVDGPARTHHNPRLGRDIYQEVDLVGYEEG
jgi:hypothetical protein